MTTHTNPLPLKMGDLQEGMKVYRILEYEILKVSTEDGYKDYMIEFKNEKEKHLAYVKVDGTVAVFFPGSAGRTRWQPIYASKGQYGGTRKNKRATRKNKRPTRRGRRRASCI